MSVPPEGTESTAGSSGLPVNFFRTFSQVVRRESATLLSLVRIQQGAHYQALTTARRARGRKSLNINNLTGVPETDFGNPKNIQLTIKSNRIILTT